MRAGTAAAAAAAAAAAWYAPALSAPWLTRDSVDVVLAHASLAGAAGGLRDWLTPRYFTLVGEGGYRPLTSLAYLLLRSAFGPSLLAFRSAKLALHLANAFSAAAIARRLGGGRRLAALGGAFYFAALAGPALLGLSFLPDILSAFFALAALRLHLQDRDSPGSGLAAAGLFLAAVLAKETAILLPLVLLAYDLLAAPASLRRPRALASREAPAWLAAAAYLAFLRWGVGAESFYGAADWRSLAPAASAAALARYAWLFFGTWGGLAAAAAALGAGARLPWRRAAFLCAWAALALAPVCGLAPFPRFSSYLSVLEPRYLALGGAALACLPACLAAAPAAFPARALAGLLLAAAALAAARRESPARESWRAGVVSQLDGSGETLPADLVLSLPLIRAREPRLFARLEPALERRAGAARARLLLCRLPDPRLYADPWQARRALRLAAAVSELGLGRRVEAEAAFQAGLDSLGAGDAARALPRLRAAFSDDETLFPACFAAAEAWRRLGRGGEAFAQASLCVEAWEGAVGGRGRPSPGAPWDPTMIRDPDEWALSRSRLERADALLAERRYDEARRAYQETAGSVAFLWPEGWQARRQAALLDSGARQAFDRGMDAFARGDSAAARAGFRRALSESPDFSEARLSRGALRAAGGRWTAALSDYRAAAAQPFGLRLRAAIDSARGTALARLDGASGARR